MRKLIFRNKETSVWDISVNGYEAEVRNGEEDQLIWQVRGKHLSDFQILDSEGIKVLAEEQKLKKKTWSLGIVYNGELFEYDDFPLVTENWMGQACWGENKVPMLMSLEEDIRVFRDERFTILHEDYQNHLQILDANDIADEFLAVWFCFWSWTRQGTHEPIDHI